MQCRVAWLQMGGVVGRVPFALVVMGTETVMVLGVVVVRVIVDVERRNLARRRDHGHGPCEHTGDETMHCSECM